MGRDNWTLTPSQIANGIEECIQAAHDLYVSGVALNYQKPQPIARALLILAVEEYGKIGWLYRGLMIHPEPGPEWADFWQGFMNHAIKNEIGRMMLMSGDSLLPALTPHFREGFPFFGIAPEALERHKQGMLYVSYDAGRRAFVGPRDDFAGNNIDNKVLIDEVGDIVRYVARNREAKVFEPRVLEEFHRLNMMARDEPDRYALLRLFYAAILRKPTGLEAEVPYDAVVANVRARYPGQVDGLVERWSAIGEQLAA